MWRLFRWSLRLVHWWRKPQFDRVSERWLREHQNRDRDDNPKAKASLSEL